MGSSGVVSIRVEALGVAIIFNITNSGLAFEPVSNAIVSEEIPSTVASPVPAASPVSKAGANPAADRPNSAHAVAISVNGAGRATDRVDAPATAATGEEAIERRTKPGWTSEEIERLRALHPTTRQVPSHRRWDEDLMPYATRSSNWV